MSETLGAIHDWGQPGGPHTVVVKTPEGRLVQAQWDGLSCQPHPTEKDVLVIPVQVAGTDYSVLVSVKEKHEVMAAVEHVGHASPDLRKRHGELLRGG